MSEWRDGASTRTVTLTPLGGTRYRASVDDATFEIEVEPGTDGRMRIIADGRVTPARVAAQGDRRFVRVGRLDFVFERVARGARRGAPHGAGLEAPMPGVVTRVMVSAGDAVKKGQPLLAIEAMKMEHLIRAPRDGVVRSIDAGVGAMVDGGVALAELEPEDA
jgi:3-methylcrotonyl-CoA carboxylase alpha subunit